MKQLLLILAFGVSLLWGQKYSYYENLKLTIRLFHSKNVDDTIPGFTEYNNKIKNPYLIDTSYYIIDQQCFADNKDWIKEKINVFYDFVETDSLPSKQHWFIDVNYFVDNYTYIGGIGIYSQIVDFLIRRRLHCIGLI